MFVKSVPYQTLIEYIFLKQAININNFKIITRIFLTLALILSYCKFAPTLVKLLLVSCMMYRLVCLSVLECIHTVCWNRLNIIQEMTEKWVFDTGSICQRWTEPYLSRLTIYPSYPALIIVLRLNAFYAPLYHIDWTIFLSVTRNEIICQFNNCIPTKRL